MTPAIQRDNVIPAPAWAAAAIATVGLGFGLYHIRIMPVPFAIILLLAVPGYILLLGYIYGDARRRRMRYVMWTWLAALLPNAIGIILYFVLREPMPVFCAHCGGVLQSGFAFCPACGSGTAPACPQCKRITQAGWSHCASCGAKL